MLTHLDFVSALIRSMFCACYKRNKFNLSQFKQRVPLLNLFIHRDDRKERDLIQSLKRVLNEKKLHQGNLISFT